VAGGLQKRLVVFLFRFPENQTQCGLISTTFPETGELLGGRPASRRTIGL